MMCMHSSIVGIIRNLLGSHRAPLLPAKKAVAMSHHTWLPAAFSTIDIGVLSNQGED